MRMMNKATVISETKGTGRIGAPGTTDFFIDMQSMKAAANAPFYYEERSGDFVARVKVKPGFKATYDAGGLLVYDTAKKWIKFEFELTDLGYPSVVSVVTNGVSDDCNGERVAGKGELWLQVARKGDNWVLHHLIDGRKWNMTRYFRLRMKEAVRVGLEAQSPRGDGCIVEFRGFTIVGGTLANLRKGE